MSTKLIIVLITLSIIHLSTSSVVRQVRDVDPKQSTSDATKAVEGAVDSAKIFFDDFLKNVKDSEFFNDLQKNLQKLGDEIQTGGKQVIEKIQNSGKN